MARRKPNPVSKDVAALILDRDLLNRLSRPIKPPRPPRSSLDKLERHILVVPDIPAIDPGPPRRSSAQRPVGRLSPGNTNAPRFLTDFDLRPIGQPSPLIGK